MDSRLDQMREECVTFHKKHPEVWRLFDRFTRDRIAKGFSHYSARAIFDHIRWHLEKPSYEKGKEFKLNDHHYVFYARAWMKVNPEHDGFFRTRVQKSANRPASDLPPLGPADFPPA